MQCSSIFKTWGFQQMSATSSRGRDMNAAAQEFKQAWRDRWHRDFCHLALFDVDNHALTIDVADFEMDDFTGAQNRAVRDGQCCAKLKASGRLDNLLDFGCA